MKNAATPIVLSLACLLAACTLSACGSEEPTQTHATPATHTTPQPDGKRESPYSDGPPGAPADGTDTPRP